MSTNVETLLWEYVYGKPVEYLRDAGGPGSGNFGHEGRPGEVGGSSSGSPVSVAALSDSAIRELTDRYENADGTADEKALEFISTAIDYSQNAPFKDSIRSAFVLDSDGRIVAGGFAIIQEDGKRAEFTTQGSVVKGGGTAVVNDLHRQLKEAGVETVYTTSLVPEFHKRFGYVETGVSTVEKGAVVLQRHLGGSGSGNFGHSGRPGEVGGSVSGDGPHLATIQSDRYGAVPDTMFRGTKTGRFEDSPIASGGELGGGIYVTADKEVADGYSEGPGHVTHEIEWVRKPTLEEIGYVEGVNGNPDDQRLLNGRGHELWRESMTNTNVKETRASLHKAAMSHGLKVVIGLDSSQGAGQIAILDRSMVRAKLRGLGGSGSGNFGHEGRPGSVGGSGGGGSSKGEKFPTKKRLGGNIKLIGLDLSAEGLPIKDQLKIINTTLGTNDSDIANARFEADRVAKALVQDADEDFDVTISFRTNPPGLEFTYDSPNYGPDELQLSRLLFRDAEGKLVADHEYFVVPPERQGAGLAKDVLRSSFAEYERLGVDRVITDANISTGQYAWARFGFVPATPEDAHTLYDQVTRRMRQLGPLSPSDSELLTQVRSSKFSKDPNPELIWKIADSPRGAEILGGHVKNPVQRWPAKLDLHNERQTSRLSTYLQTPNRKSPALTRASVRSAIAVRINDAPKRGELFYFDADGIRQDNELWSELLQEDLSPLRTAGGVGSGVKGHTTPKEIRERAIAAHNKKVGRPAVIEVSSVKEAIPLILAGKVVEMKNVHKVNTLLTKLAAIAKDAEKKGDKAPNYDACKINVSGSSFFCGGSLRTKEYPNGMPRVVMPQFGGVPTPGSKADKLSKDEDGRVDAGPEFLAHLEAKGISFQSGNVPAAHLMASQNELNGPTIAKRVAKDVYKSSSSIFISRDNYVIDGHHRWAAIVGRDAADKHLGDLKIRVIRVDAPITEILHDAVKWSKAFGLKGITAASAFRGAAGWAETLSALSKSFTFPNRRSLASFLVDLFTDANVVNHHPDVVTEGDGVLVKYTTHDAEDTVTAADHICTDRVDAIAEGIPDIPVPAEGLHSLAAANARAVDALDTGDALDTDTYSDIRVSGEAAGHPFHGNQYSAGGESGTPHEYSKERQGKAPSQPDASKNEHVDFKGRSVKNGDKKSFSNYQASDKWSNDLRAKGWNVVQKDTRVGFYSSHALTANDFPYKARIDGRLSRVSERHATMSLQLTDAAHLLPTGMRAAGDVVGHEFHGNQWTTPEGEQTSYARPPKGSKIPDVYWGSHLDAKKEYGRKGHAVSVEKRYVDIKHLEPTADIVPEKLRGISVGHGAQLPAIGVNQFAKGHVEIIDGNHRVEKWRRAGFTHAPAWVVVGHGMRSRLRRDLAKPKLHPIHVAADRFVPTFQRRVQRALDAGRAAASADGSPDKVVSAIRKALPKAELEAAYLDILTAGGKVAEDHLHKSSLRLAGDAPGHGFHGNQWTSTDGKMFGKKIEPWPSHSPADVIRTEVKDVDLRLLRPTQDNLAGGSFVSKGDPIDVYVRDGRYYIGDGHNRVNGALQSGKKTIRANVVYLKSEMRHAGDVPGHEFHGNQWTSGVRDKRGRFEPGDRQHTGSVFANKGYQALNLDEEARATRGSGEVKFVKLSSLIPTQSSIKRELDPKHEYEKLPVVLQVQGKNFIVDGHHQLATKIKSGMVEASVRFYVYKEPRTASAIRSALQSLKTLGDVVGHEFHGNQWKEGPHAEHLGQLTKGPDVTSAHIEKITAVLNALPTGFMKETGSPNVHLTTKTIQSTGQSRGGHAAAQYNADENSVKVNVVGAPGRTATKPESALVHELGHAFQTRTGVSVEDAFQKDLKSMKPHDAHFLTHYTVSSREAFAQAVAHTYGKVSNRAEFSRAFKNTITATQEHLRAKGAMPTALAKAKYDRTNEHAIEWAKSHAADFIDGIDKTTRENIREAIAATLEGELSQDDAADFIAASIGDEARAEMIAQTETMTAALEGQRQFWSEAQDAGDLPEDAVRTWVTFGDSCPECTDMEGETAELDEDYPEDGGEGPPLHPNCRCIETIGRPKEGRAAGSGSSGNFGHAGRKGEVGGSSSEASWLTKGPEFEARKKSLVLPPAWKHVHINEDPKAALQATGTDVKGRTQYRYSKEHSADASAEKFERLKEFTAALPGIRAAIAKDLKNPESDDAREAAAVLALIDKTGFRIGSDSETGADKKAYGASTLLAKHVTIDGDTVSFAFGAKKGVDIEKTVKDEGLAKLIQPRVKEGGRLFATTDMKVREYLHKHGGGDFTPKDFRTWHGTTEALRAIKGMDAPTTAKAFKTSQKEVAKSVSSFLGNTPSVALASYIDPAVWGPWKAKLK